MSKNTFLLILGSAWIGSVLTLWFPVLLLVLTVVLAAALVPTVTTYQDRPENSAYLYR